ncbi:uncharacterized protein LOC134317547 [Trichomycterus rosablanca]|uniref:uncharacterized protein LOC134317547 n=1 Tax=Trichomycterus rosablanca TaxID=2290929 RepID=UPI002F3540D1
MVQLNLVEEPELVILKEQGKGHVKNKVYFIENEMKKVERQVDPVDTVKKPKQVGKNQMENQVLQTDQMTKVEERVDQVGLKNEVNKPEEQVGLQDRRVVLVNLVKEPERDEAPEHQWTELEEPAALEHQIWKLKEQNLDRGCTEDPLKNISEVSSNKPDHEQLQDDVLVPPIIEAQPEESGALMESVCEDKGVPMPKLRRTSLRTKRFQFFNV